MPGRDAGWRSWNENVEFVSNSHNFHCHAHPASKLEAGRASDHYFKSSRAREEINGGWSARGLRWRCVHPVFFIKQADYEPKGFHFPAQLGNLLFLYAQNFVQILHNFPFVDHFGNRAGQPVG